MQIDSRVVPGMEGPCLPLPEELPPEGEAQPHGEPPSQRPELGSGTPQLPVTTGQAHRDCLPSPRGQKGGSHGSEGLGSRAWLPPRFLGELHP